MKKIIYILLMLFVVSNSFAQKTELINSVEGEWLFVYSKGPWGETSPKTNGFEEIISFTKSQSTDSILFSIFVADTLFYKRKHQLFIENKNDKTSLFLSNSSSESEIIEFISENIIRRSMNSYNGGYIEYKRIESDIADNVSYLIFDE